MKTNHLHAYLNLLPKSGVNWFFLSATEFRINFGVEVTFSFSTIFYFNCLNAKFVRFILPATMFHKTGFFYILLQIEKSLLQKPTSE